MIRVELQQSDWDPLNASQVNQQKPTQTSRWTPPPKEISSSLKRIFSELLGIKTASPSQLFPDEIFLKIFSFFSAEQLARQAFVCHHWKKVSEDNTLWKKLCLEKGLYETVIRIDDWKQYYIHSYVYKFVNDIRSAQKDHCESWKAHHGEITILEAKDGIVATASYNDNTAYVCSLKRRKVIAYLYGHHSAITCLKIYRDRIVTSSHDYTVRIWGGRNYKCLTVLKMRSHKMCIRTMHIWNEFLICGSDDGIITLRGFSDFRLQRKFTGHRANNIVFKSLEHLLKTPKFSFLMNQQQVLMRLQVKNS